MNKGMLRCNILLDLPDDIMHMIAEYLQYRRAAIELKTPHFQRSLASIRTQRGRYGANCIHPGRDLVRIIRPRLSFCGYSIDSYKGERVNVYGLTFLSRWDGRCVLDCTHADLDRVLEELSYKRYKSKLR
eukprot:COSAG01_NODE_13405_length_1590_cov_1.273642_1_plen_129_part_10